MFIIQVHAQANPWANQGDDQHCFSVQWTVGTAQSESLPSELKKYVLPWNWSDVKISVLVQMDEKWSKIGERRLENGVVPETVRERLIPFENACTQEPHLFEISKQGSVWKPRQGDPLGNPVAAQGELAHLPHPIPVRLNLGGSILLSSEDIKNATKVALLPVFKVDSEPRRLDEDSIEQEASTVFFRVSYESIVDGPPYTAIFLPIGLPVPKGALMTQGQIPETSQVHQKFGDYRERLAQVLDIPRQMQSLGLLKEFEPAGLLEYLCITTEHFRKEFSFLKLKELPNLDIPDVADLKKRLETTFYFELLNQAYRDSRQAFVEKLLEQIKDDSQKQDDLRAYLSRWRWQDEPVSSLWVQNRVAKFMRNLREGSSPLQGLLTIAGTDYGALVGEGQISQTLEEYIQTQLSELQGQTPSPWHRTPVGLTSFFELTSGDRIQNIQWIFFLRDVQKKTWRCLNLVKLPKFDPELIAPYRVPIGEKQTLLTYRNQPYHATFRAKASSQKNSQIVYQNAYGGSRKLPRLSFGLSYQTAALPVGHGCLDNMVQHTDSWMRLSLDDKLQIKVDNSLIYLRDVRVSAPRMVDLTIQEIPKTVHPLARSLSSLQGEKERSAPLLLLKAAKPETAPIEFKVFKPSCDLTTWEHCLRLVDSPPSRPWEFRREKFAGQLSKFLEALSPKPDTPINRRLEPEDVPTDPFVDYIELTIVTHKVTAPQSSIPTTFRLSAETIQLRVRDESWFLVVKKWRRNGGPNEDEEVLLEPGTVTHLIFRPVVHHEVYGRFVGPVNENRVWDKDESASGVKEGNDCLRVYSAQTNLLIEVPSNRLPSQEELRKALELELTPERRLVVGLRASRDSSLNFSCSYEFFTQRWLWSGRPVNAGSMREINLEETNDDLEGHLFGERDDHDGRVYHRSIDFASLWNVDSPDRLRVTPVTMDLSGDLDCQMHRFGLRVRSRYEGWLDELKPIDSRLEGWKSFLVRSQFSGTLPAPRPLLILPLTDANSDSPVAPLLLVLRETWFGLGGLGEVLDCQVAQILNPHDQDQALVNQMGPDPILRPSGDLTSDIVNLEVEGPLGHTFDEEVTLNPLYRRASFIVYPPEGAQPWDFLQLRFQRTLLGQSRGQSTEDLESGWTRPIWGQLLPSATELSRPLRQVYLDDRKIKFAEPPQVPSEFEWWLLLTSLKSDVHGNRNVELYEDLKPLNDLSLPKPGTYLIRLVEVQNISADLRDSSVEDIWERLFPEESDNPVEPQSRIIRMSPPTRLLLKNSALGDLGGPDIG